MELNNITNTGTWGEQATRLNDNFNKVALGIDTLQSAYQSLSQSAIEAVDALPQTGEANKIYRLVGTTSYSDYMYNTDDLTTPILMATYNNAIDNTPTANSANLVTSGGVADALALGAVYDVSANNPTAGANNDGKWESISALLSDANLNTLIPISVRKGGMSVKFVLSSDNKYVQYRLMDTSFSTNEKNWQGVDDAPTAGSENLIASGGVYKNSVVTNIIKGFGVTQNGTVIGNINWCVTNYIPVSGISILKWKSGDATNPSFYKLVLFDDEYNVIDFLSTTSTDYRIIDISSYNAAFIRASFYLPNEYDLTDGNGNSLINTFISQTDEEPAKNSTKAVTSNGVYNATHVNLLQGFSINSVGNEVENEGWGATDYIEVPNGITSISWLSGVPELPSVNTKNVLCAFDASKTFIDYWSPYVSSRTINLSANVKYIRASFYLTGTHFLTDNYGNDIIKGYNLEEIFDRHSALRRNVIRTLSEIKTINRNFVNDCYINADGNVRPYDGINISERIPVTETTFTWNYGSGTYYDSAKLCLFGKDGKLIDFWTMQNTTTNSRTIDISQKEWVNNAAFIVFPFSGDNASLVQGQSIWVPKLSLYTANNVEHIEVGNYNVGAYRMSAAYMSEEDKDGFLKQLKSFMNGKINKDILFVQEDVYQFTFKGNTIKTYNTFYKNFYPYFYLCQDYWPAIYSKYPLKNTRKVTFTYESGGETKTRNHAFADIEINGKTIGLASIHCNFDSRALRRKEYEMIINELKDYEYVIIAGDLNCSEIEASNIGYNEDVENTFGKVGYKSANFGYWGNIHTQTDANAQGELEKENQIDTFLTRGFAINSFDVLPVAYYDHMPCVSKLNFSLI